jgi:hypothetical protein
MAMVCLAFLAGTGAISRHELVARKHCRSLVRFLAVAAGQWHDSRQIPAIEETDTPAEIAAASAARAEGGFGH